MNKKFSKGFTLIEILAVVLIIGILSAIALPKYTAAADKAKIAKYETMVKSIADAIKRLDLVRDKWNYTFAELDIELPDIKNTISISEGPSKGEIALFDWGYCYIVEASENWNDEDLFCGGYDLVGYLQTIKLHTGEDTFATYCVSDENNQRGIRLCDTYAPTYTWGSFWGPNAELVFDAKASNITR